MVDPDPILEPRLNLPPCLLYVLPGILTYMWFINLGMITHLHCYDWTSFDDCVELWVISLLEISHIFPLIVVDINEPVEVGGQTIGLLTDIVDGESQSSKEVMNYIL